METIQKIEEFKKVIEQANTARTRAELQKEQLEKQQQGIIEEMTKYGVTPETIGEKISALDENIKVLLIECEGIAAKLREVLGQ